MKVQKERVHPLNDRPRKSGPVVYWMSRDQRAEDNWALLYAQEQALDAQVPLTVLFNLVPRFLGATMRQYGFMLRGLEETASRLHRKNIGFVLLEGDPVRLIPPFLEKEGAGLLVSDFDPLRVKRDWRSSVAGSIKVPFMEVDAHNIVPCRVASEKLEFAAHTFRPRVKGKLDRYMVPFPPLKKHPFGRAGQESPVDWQDLPGRLKVDRGVGEVSWAVPGPGAGRRVLRKFLKEGLTRYDEDRNDPVKEAQSGLSPWLHFGQLSAQRVALEVLGAGKGPGSEAFLEELVVRRELADNFCFRNREYDSVSSFHPWALKTLDAHRPDRRSPVYSARELDQAGTHDPYWNAAQMQMVKTGKMHGYMRMYWAKKILEWSPSPEEAMEAAIALNDRYELDGRDPNGYAGIAWSIGGVHDRAWGERAIFGKIRYMNARGLERKFDMGAYVEKWGREGGDR